MCKILVLNVSSPCDQYPHKRAPYVVSNCKMMDVHIKSIIRARVRSISQLWASSSLFSDVFGASTNSPHMNSSYNNNKQKILNKIFQDFSDTLDIPIKPDPILIIVWVSKEFLRLTRVQNQFVSYRFISAKKTYHFVCEENRIFNS